MVCDYFLIRGTELDVNSLYHREGAYYYTKGVNPRAMVALVLGVAIALVGVFVPPLHFFYDYAWFVGFFDGGREVSGDDEADGAGGVAGKSGRSGMRAASNL